MTTYALGRPYDMALKCIFWAVTAFVALFVSLAPMRRLILFVPDDASYYLKIAQNVCEGNGFSFDGLHPTNGFQPLWQYILVVFMWLVRTGPENTVRLVLLLQLFLLSVAAGLFYQTLRRHYGSKALLAGTAVFVAFVLPQSANGMETALLVLMLAILFHYAEKHRLFIRHNPRKEWVLGLLLGLTALTRLDTVFFWVPVYLLLLAQAFRPRPQKKDVMRLLAITAGIVVVVLPYLAYNQIRFGHVVPISGHLKFDFPQVSIAGKFRDLLAHRESYFAAAAPFYLVWFFVYRKRYGSSFFPWFLAVMATGVFLLFLYHLLFMRWIFFSWYFMPYSLFTALATVFFADTFFSTIRFRGLPWMYGLFVVLVLAYRIQNYAVYTHMGNNWSLYTYDAAQWTKNHTAPTDILAMRDAGHFGFFSERRVINLDGLVNTFEYQDILHHKQLNAYLAENHVAYIAQHSLWNHEEVTDGEYGAFPFTLPAKMYGTVSDTVWLRKENEVYHSAAYEEGGYRVAFMIWKRE